MNDSVADETAKGKELSSVSDSLKIFFVLSLLLDRKTVSKKRRHRMSDYASCLDSFFSSKKSIMIFFLFLKQDVSLCSSHAILLQRMRKKKKKK